MLPAADPPPVRSLAFVGAGAAATVLALRAVEVGLDVAAVASRTPASAERLAGRVSARAVSLEGALQAGADAVAFCVPDGALAAVARAAARHAAAPALALHTSGALGTGVLVPLALAGWTTLGFHPAQALTLETPPSALVGAAAGLDGSSRAVASGRLLAERLGLVPVVLDPSGKAAYHAALSLASNFAVTLAAMSHELLRGAGVADPHVVVGPLLRGTLANLDAAPPARALTGPIARGDAETVGAHLRVLRRLRPQALPAYCALAAETVRLARASERLSPARAQALLDLLHDAVAPGDGVG